MSDLSSLALPESPELPADVQGVIWTLVAQAKAVGIMMANESRSLPTEKVRLEESERELASVIAKHLLTAEEARVLADVSRCGEWLDEEHPFAKSVLAKLRRLSGSSRGEE